VVGLESRRFISRSHLYIARRNLVVRARTITTKRVADLSAIRSTSACNAGTTFQRLERFDRHGPNLDARAAWPGSYG
jgi:hypothetical protein